MIGQKLHHSWAQLKINRLNLERWYKSIKECFTMKEVITISQKMPILSACVLENVLAKNQN